MLYIDAIVQTSIRTDADDEAASADSLTVPHVGPVEAKVSTTSLYRVLVMCSLSHRC